MTPQGTPETLLGVPAERFLAEFWQQRPLFRAQALPGFDSPISPDELRELAEDDAMPSRLVLGGQRPNDWRVEYGGFAPSRFKKLPKNHWTLLVSEVDHVWSDAERLLARFDFLPHWRRDDLMISLAAPGGSVGPHVDAYDVFLLQARGTRRWSLEWPVAQPAPEQRLVAGLPLKILDTFHPTEHHDCQPGDLLYLPPGVPHHGVATSDDCMTFSIGFRSPSARQAITAALAELGNTVDLDALHFGDPQRGLPRPIDAAPGARRGAYSTATHELGAADRGLLRDWLRATLARLDDASLDRALGRLLSRPLVDRHGAGDTPIGDIVDDDAHDRHDADAYDVIEVIEVIDGDERLLESRRGNVDAPRDATPGASRFAHWPRNRRLIVDPALRRYWSEDTDPDHGGSTLYIDGHVLRSHLRHGPAVLERLCREESLAPREWLERFPDHTDAVLARLLDTGRLIDPGA